MLGGVVVVGRIIGRIERNVDVLYYAVLCLCSATHHFAPSFPASALALRLSASVLTVFLWGARV